MWFHATGEIDSMKYSKRSSACLLVVLLLCLHSTAWAQQADSTAEANSKKAHALLDAMVQAYGGARWLDLTSWHIDGQLAGFDHGRPEMATLSFWDFQHVVTDAQGHKQLQERVELGKHRDDVELFIDGRAWEVTYRGRTLLPKEPAQDYAARRAHSLFTMVQVWRNDPRTLFLSKGQSMVERRLADKITLISADNLSTTLELDAATHLPLRLSFDIANPLYGDLDHEAEEYDDYQTVQGFPTAYRITRYKNGEEVRETYVTHASYGDASDPNLYDLMRTEQAVHK
jgi:hypothetical protein